MSDYKFETLQLHIGRKQADSASDACAVPVCAATSYVIHYGRYAADRISDLGAVFAAV